LLTPTDGTWDSCCECPAEADAAGRVNWLIGRFLDRAGPSALSSCKAWCSGGSYTPGKTHTAWLKDKNSRCRRNEPGGHALGRPCVGGPPAPRLTADRRTRSDLTGCARVCTQSELRSAWNRRVAPVPRQLASATWSLPACSLTRDGSRALSLGQPHPGSWGASTSFPAWTSRANGSPRITASARDTHYSDQHTELDLVARDGAAGLRPTGRCQAGAAQPQRPFGGFDINSLPDRVQLIDAA
jgi:hypothetical protein